MAFKVISSVGLAVAIAALAAGTFALTRSATEEPYYSLDQAATAKADPAAYTKAFVDEAIRRFEETGRDATIEYYNSPESVDGEWYMFIADEDDVMIAHAAVPENVGEKVEDILGPDGYPAGRMVVAGAREGGAWVPYTYINPATGDAQSKHSWAVKREGLLFGSGWYEDGPSKADREAYTVAYVDKALDLYESLGIEATVSLYNSPESVDGSWSLFLIDEDGYTISQPREEIRGRGPGELVDITGYFYGDDLLGAPEEGRWVDYVFLNIATGREEIKHTWAVRRDGHVFASGWHERYIGRLPSP